ncbi:hypothetical protein HVIM_03900 (plasmid) [Roseomonas mucosa]|uniref:hypothetical protein n=1 Tax=Roseomonas mucosa TaxID=207340 RepID=UPI000DB0ECB0|nr:hypothetical protein [Roseomonas mucosa]PZP44298.1 MAG: hypothetical protein DI601_12840 [Azospirillum brasilense]QDD92816.1 hypothetical protein HVIM_03900 [Roseomonas mucosa]
MPRKRPPTAEDHRRALRRQAAVVASDLARKLPTVPGELNAVGALVIGIFQGQSSGVFSEIDDNQSRYEGHDESWFSLLRQVRNHSEWGPRLFQALGSDQAEEAA